MKKSIITNWVDYARSVVNSYPVVEKIYEKGNFENNYGGMQTNSIDPTIGYESPY